MANKIQLRRGLKSKLPTLSSGEPAYTTDTRELYVGTGSGNVNMGGSLWYTGTAMSGTSSTTGAYSYSSCPIVKAGDMYLNSSNGNMYQCTTAGSGTSAKWTYKGCIKGATGATGATGAAGKDAVVTADTRLSRTSKNPLENQAITELFKEAIAPVMVKNIDAYPIIPDYRYDNNLGGLKVDSASFGTGCWRINNNTGHDFDNIVEVDGFTYWLYDLYNPTTSALIEENQTALIYIPNQLLIETDKEYFAYVVYKS